MSENENNGKGLIPAGTMPFPEMQTELTVSMDDVVSAFVATYENNNFAKKKALSKAIKEFEKELDELDKLVLAKITGDEYESKSVKPYDLIAEVESSTIQWGEELTDNKVHFSIVITVNGKTNHSRYANNQINISREKEIPATFVEEHDKIKDALEPLRTELAEVLDNIKTIARKERQVRGRIAIRKLEDSGYASLMNDPELKQLVELD